MSDAESPETTGPRVPYTATQRRKVLCVSPRLSHSMATMDNAFEILDVKAFSPVQGLLLIAAYLPKGWDVRFVDESLGPVTDADLSWSDAVLVTGMHIQRRSVDEIVQRAQALGKVTVLGGPSVSGSPDYYPHVDILHIGELGDATDALIARLDRDVSRPAAQERFETKERLPLNAFPIPAYHLVNLNNYLMGTVQFSSGCPYRCEFCDIPELYGRTPRTKTPAQVTAELDAMLEQGNPGAVYIVDDNFIGSKKQAIELLKALIVWQKERGYPITFGCEATLNLAQWKDVLELMHEAAFQIIFCGVETPEISALKGMNKDQNLRLPILDAIQVLNDYGLFVVSGIIFGFDTDTPGTREAVRKFIDVSHVPFLTINVLTALPRTPLWRRLEEAGRLNDGEGRESNIEFLMPYDDVVGAWRDCVGDAYTPEALFERLDWQFQHVFPRRKPLPNSPARVNRANLMKAARVIPKILWHMGVKADYRKRFWKTAGPILKSGKLDELILVSMMAYHLIIFGREATAGHIRAGLYNPEAESVSSLAAT